MEDEKTGLIINNNKIIEQGLKKHEMNYRRLFENLPDAVILLDPYSWKIVDINAVACEMNGYSYEELVRQPIEVLDMGDLDISTKQQFVERIRKEGKVHFETYHRRKDGTVFPVDCVCCLVDLGDYELILGMDRDISERKRMEKKLENEDAFRQSVIKHMTEGLCVCNNIDVFPFIRFTVWNERMKEITGYSMEEINRKGFIETLFSADSIQEKARNRIMQIWSGEHIGNELMEFRRSDGEKRTVSVSTTQIKSLQGCTHVLALMTDITRHYQAARALKESEERYRTLFNGGHDAILVHELEAEQRGRGKIIECNLMAAKKLGYSRKEFMDLCSEDIIAPDYQNYFEQIRDNLLKQTYVLFQIDFLTKQGNVITMEVTSHISEVSGKKVVVSMARDISERIQLEKEIARLDRLNLVGEMAVAIGHEIRNPMTTVRGFLQMLNQREDCMMIRDYLNIMIEELDGANTIITEFISLAKDRLIEKKPDNLNLIIHKIYPLIAADAMLYDQDFSVDLDEVADILIDEKEIRQMILNLAMNAHEAMDKGGNLLLSTYMEDNQVVLCVSDTGKGILPEDMDKIGRPFFSTKAHGVGLGLSVCYSIAARHHAHISIESGRWGTRVYVRFPVYQNH